VQSQWSHYFIAGMALCLIYRTGFTWPLGVILALAYSNAVYQAINFAQHGPRPGTTRCCNLPVGGQRRHAHLRHHDADRVPGDPAGSGGRGSPSAGALTYPLYLVHAYKRLRTVQTCSAGHVNPLGPCWVALLLLMAGAA